MSDLNQTAAIDGNTVLRVVDRAVTFLDYDEQASVLMDPNRPDWVKTSASGKWLFETLREQPSSLDGLVEATSEYYGLPAEAVATPVRRFVETLLSHGFLLTNASPISPSEIQPDDMLPDDLPSVGLTSVWFNLLSQCNLHCAHCFLPESGAKGPIELENAKQIIDTLAKQGVKKLCLSGGEPLLHPEIEAIVEHARAQGDWLVFIITNGTAGDPEMIERLTNVVDYFQVSVDGVDEQTHDQVRSPGTFARATRFIQLINSKKGRAKTYLSFTPHPANVDQIPKLFRFALDLGIDCLSITKPKRPARHSSSSDPCNEEFLSYEFRRRVFAKYDELVLTYLDQVKGLSTYKGLKIPAIDSNFDPALNLLLCIRRACCGAGATTLFIDEMGDCYPCVAMIKPEHRLGNVLQEPFDTIYHDRAIRGFRQSIHVDHIEECSSCSFRLFCAGDCRALADDARARTPYCEMVKERYHRLLRGVRASE